MECDAEDFQALQEQHDPLVALYAEFEQSRSSETVKAMHAVCRSARRITNPSYCYAIEQIGWIEGSLRPRPAGHDPAAIYQAITRFRNALVRLKP